MKLKTLQKKSINIANKSLWMPALLFLLSLSLYTSCCKSGTCLSGTVLENGAETPVAGVEVEIIAGKAVGLFEPAIEWVTGTATTDGNGKFSITVEDAAYYKVGRFIKEGYFETLGSRNKRGQNPLIAESGAQSDPTYFIDAAGTLHVVVENDPGVEGDFILIRAPEKPIQEGTFSKIEEIYKVRANRFQLYSYKIDNNPTVFDSIFVISYDTAQLRIIF